VLSRRWSGVSGSSDDDCCGSRPRRSQLKASAASLVTVGRQVHPTPSLSDRHPGRCKMCQTSLMLINSRRLADGDAADALSAAKQNQVPLGIEAGLEKAHRQGCECIGTGGGKANCLAVVAGDKLTAIEDHSDWPLTESERAVIENLIVVALGCRGGLIISHV